jgi:hypothetical protein
LLVVYALARPGECINDQHLEVGFAHPANFPCVLVIFRPARRKMTNKEMKSTMLPQAKKHPSFHRYRN